ncbi:MAG TPA: hypothetical protein PKW35_06010, partial [Nannocystaceae bacterium]|nr:hypothetical protein [Nannocystaceae bacterium]
MRILAGVIGLLLVVLVSQSLLTWPVPYAWQAGIGATEYGHWVALIAILLALVLNAIGLNAHLPGPLLTGIHWLGQCAIPMALMLIGAIVADHLHEFHSKSGWRVIGAAVLLRLGVLPVLFLLAAKFLPASVELKRVMVL